MANFDAEAIDTSQYEENSAPYNAELISSQDILFIGGPQYYTFANNKNDIQGNFGSVTNIIPIPNGDDTMHISENSKSGVLSIPPIVDTLEAARFSIVLDPGFWWIYLINSYEVPNPSVGNINCQATFTPQITTTLHRSVFNLTVGTLSYAGISQWSPALGENMQIEVETKTRLWVVHNHPVSVISLRLVQVFT